MPQPFPHIYTVDASGAVAGNLRLNSEGAPELLGTAPREFDGPGDQWSPESLLVAAVASCFILTFRAVARASKLEWARLECTVEGALERSEGLTQFTRIVTKAKLIAPQTTSEELCVRLLEKTEHNCLITNSLRAQRELRTQIVRE
ncbi:MAG TPA: OsmC family protein [Steroidobacter sp.]|jgi:peroxiredoxin-like protein|nr:OsmC family protein [Steroidobacter sp.]